MEKLIEALKGAILALGAEAVLMPQTAATGACRVELYLAGLSVGGEARGGGPGWESVRFTALVKSDGTHDAWLADTVRFARLFAPLEEAPMPVLLATAEKTLHLKAHWKRLQEGRFEYPEEEAGSMPVSYVETWQVDLMYPGAMVE